MAADSDVHAVAKAYIVLGLVAACFAKYAMSLDPATFHHLQLQMSKDSGHQPEQVQGQTNCTVTAAEVMEMRTDAVVLLMYGVVEAWMATASVGATSRLGTLVALLLSMPMTWILTDVFTGVVHVSIGRCDDRDIYQKVIVPGYSLISMSSGVLLIAGLLVVFCG